MTNEASIIDPLGNKVFLLEQVCKTDASREKEMYDDAATVIQKPIILVEVNSNYQKELHYFRSIGWHHTLLISVKYINGRWEAFDCTLNPPNEHLAQLLKNGKQII